MSETFRLGRIAGIRIGVNWSVLIIVGLIWVMLSTSALPAAFPAEVPLVHVLAGAGAAVLFIASLLSHELAHALVAKRNGVQVEGITLWLLGGVAKLAGDPARPGAEFRISAVGPLTSFGLALGFGGTSWALWLVEAAGILIGVFSWLALINLALAVFNMIPAAPLDGGRLLRALIWTITGNRTKATIVSARTGRVFGIALIGAGAVWFVLTPGINGIWLAILGWFIVTAASGEEQYAGITRDLEGLRVRDVMSAPPVWIPAGTSVVDGLQHYVWQSGHTTFPVVDRFGRVLGLATLDRLRHVPATEHHRVSVEAISMPVSDVVMVDPATALTDLLPKVVGTSPGRALVLENGQLVGIVSTTDLNRAIRRAQLRREVQRIR